MLMWRVDLHNPDRDHDYDERLGEMDEGFLHFRTEEEARSFARRLIPHLPFPSLYFQNHYLANPLRKTCQEGKTFVSYKTVEEEAQTQEVRGSFYQRAPVAISVYEVTPEKKNPGEPYEPASQKLVLQTQLKKREEKARQIEYTPEEGTPVWTDSQSVSVYPVEFKEFEENETTMARVYSFLLHQR